MTKINRPFEIRRYREIALQAYCSLPVHVTPLQGNTPSTPRFEGNIYKRFFGRSTAAARVGRAPGRAPVRWGSSEGGRAELEGC